MEAGLILRGSSRVDRTTQRDPVFVKTKPNQTNEGGEGRRKVKCVHFKTGRKPKVLEN